MEEVDGHGLFVKEGVIVGASDALMQVVKVAQAEVQPLNETELEAEAEGRRVVVSMLL